MRSVFDIIGPVMVGPSSSHTAGAVRIGLVGRSLLGGTPKDAEIRLHGSFAATHSGHGTDKALLGGLLGFAPDDIRIRDAFQYAAESGMNFRIIEAEIPNAHPNTAILRLVADNGEKVDIQATSVGGGSIEVSMINGYEVHLTGEYDSIMTIHKDSPGMVAAVGSILACDQVNIAFMRLSRKHKGEEALMLLENDSHVSEKTLQAIAALAPVVKVFALPKLMEDDI